jgi:hypothetical protein
MSKAHTRGAATDDGDDATAVVVDAVGALVLAAIIAAVVVTDEVCGAMFV